MSADGVNLAEERSREITTAQDALRRLLSDLLGSGDMYRQVLGGQSVRQHLDQALVHVGIAASWLGLRGMAASGPQTPAAETDSPAPTTRTDWRDAIEEAAKCLRRGGDPGRETAKLWIALAAEIREWKR